MKKKQNVKKTRKTTIKNEKNVSWWHVLSEIQKNRKIKKIIQNWSMTRNKIICLWASYKFHSTADQNNISKCDSKNEESR